LVGNVRLHNSASRARLPTRRRQQKLGGHIRHFAPSNRHRFLAVAGGNLLVAHAASPHGKGIAAGRAD
jgi:hypothetical protein